MDEIEAPWLKYPNFPPYDGFWRQTGEYWLNYVWRPYWVTLDSAQKKEYLDKYPPPDVWLNMSTDLNPAFAAELERIDVE
jgi:hypothetical protein